MDHTFHTPSFGDEDFSIPQFNHHLGATNEVATSDYNALAKTMSPPHYQNHWNNDVPMTTYGGYNHQQPHILQSSIHHQQQQQQHMQQSPSRHQPQPVAVQQMHSVSDIKPPIGTTAAQLYVKNEVKDESEENGFVNNNKSNNKRPSPAYTQNNEVEDQAKANPAKKAKVVKKKAKKDPNEPQK